MQWSSVYVLLWDLKVSSWTEEVKWFPAHHPTWHKFVTVLCEEEAVQSDSWPGPLIYWSGTRAKICCSPHVRPRAKTTCSSTSKNLIPSQESIMAYLSTRVLWTAGWNVLFQNNWTVWLSVVHVLQNNPGLSAPLVVSPFLVTQE